MKIIEQKAKAYDEAIKVIKDNLDALNEITETGADVVNIQSIRNCFYRAFPELAMSDDERIRKALIELVEYAKKNCLALLDKPFNAVSMDAMLAWLEKLEVFAKYGDGLYYFGNNGFTYVGNSTCDNVSWFNKQSEKPQGKTALEAIKEKEVDNRNCVKPTDKVEPKFKVKYAGNEYNVLETKDIAGVTYYGIEDEPNHIDYVLPDNCEIISSYVIKENGSSYPTKSAVFSEQKPVTIDIEKMVMEYSQTKDDDFGKPVNCMIRAYRQGLTDAIAMAVLKPSWSEEDMFKVQRICTYLDEAKKYYADITEVRDCIDWLKSLKDRIQR